MQKNNLLIEIIICIKSDPLIKRDGNKLVKSNEKDNYWTVYNLAGSKADLRQWKSFF